MTFLEEITYNKVIFYFNQRNKKQGFNITDADNYWKTYFRG